MRVKVITGITDDKTKRYYRPGEIIEETPWSADVLANFFAIGAITAIESETVKEADHDSGKE